MQLGGILLCGGLGTRLFPTTKYMNKHLLPIYDKPMVYYSLSILMLSGVKDITIVTNSDEIEVFEELLGNGSELGITINYSEQKSPKGIPDAISEALKIKNYEKFMVVLGDNFIYGEKFFTRVENIISKTSGPVIFTQKVKNPENFGVLKSSDSGEIILIEEKPKQFVSNEAIIGVYLFDELFREKFKKITPSNRGEYEILDILKEYGLANINHFNIGRGTAWFDMGSTGDFMQSTSFVATIQERQGLLVCSPHEIAFRNSWISKQELNTYLESISNSEYGEGLESVLKSI